MRTLNLLIILLVLSIGALGKGNLTFEKANQLYHNKEYGRALELYNQLINNNFSSPDLFYNTGNAYFKSEKIGLAIWAYKNSLNLSKRQNTLDNYRLAVSKIKQPIAAQPEIFFLRWWKAIYSIFSINQWAIISLVSFIIAMVLLFRRRWTSTKPILTFQTRMLLILSAVTFFFMGVNRYAEASNCEAVIVQETFYSSQKDWKTQSPISAGIEVKVKDQLKSSVGVQYRVQLPNTKEVWLKERDIKFLK